MRGEDGDGSERSFISTYSHAVSIYKLAEVTALHTDFTR